MRSEGGRACLLSIRMAVSALPAATKSTASLQLLSQVKEGGLPNVGATNWALCSARRVVGVSGGRSKSCTKFPFLC